MKKITNCVLLIGFFLTLLFPLSTKLKAQVPYFEKSFGEPGVDIAFSVKQDGDSSVYVFGYSNNTSTSQEDFALSKLRPNGDLIWTKYYGTPDIDFGLYMNLADSFDVIMVGHIETNTSLGQEILVIKVDSSGQELWRRNYGGIGNQSCRYIEKTTDGNYILCGYRTDPFGQNDIYVLKLDANGNFLWDASFGGINNDYGMKAFETPGHKLLMSADTKSSGNGGYDAAIYELDSLGNELWSNLYGDQFQNGCQGVMLTSSNVNVVFGETEVFQFSPFDFFLYMFDSTGAFLREKVFGGLGTDALFDMLETPTGDLIGCGYSNSASNGVLPLNLALVKTDSLGNVQFVREYGSSGIDIGYSITPALGGGYYVAGRITNADEDFYLLHIDENGLVGLNENAALSTSKISIWPNPTREYLTVNSGFKAESWAVFDLKGKELMHFEGELSNVKTINISNLAGGIYLLELRSVNKKESSKFIKLD